MSILLKTSSIKNLTEMEIRLKIDEYYYCNKTIKPNILIIDSTPPRHTIWLY